MNKGTTAKILGEISSRLGVKTICKTNVTVIAQVYANLRFGCRKMSANFILETKLEDRLLKTRVKFKFTTLLQNLKLVVTLPSHTISLIKCHRRD